MSSRIAKCLTLHARLIVRSNSRKNGASTAVSPTCSAASGRIANPSISFSTVATPGNEEHSTTGFGDNPCLSATFLTFRISDQRDAHWLAGGGEAWEAIKASRDVRDHVNRFLIASGAGHVFQLSDFVELTFEP